MNLFKKMWYKNEAKLKGYAYVSGKQQDTQSAFVSQGVVKK